MKLTTGPITPRVLGDQVVVHLRDGILAGTLADGERIVEDEIAAALGVSRGPVRDAFRQLELEGLIVRVPRHGARVASMTASDADEILAIRAAIEPVAARYLAQRGEPEVFDPLDACLDRLDVAAQRDDWPAAVLLDMEFHGLLYAAAAKRRLQRIWETLGVPMLQTFRLHRQFYEAIDEVPRRHRVLLDTIKSGNVEAAERATKEHVLEFRDLLLASMAADQAAEDSAGPT